MDSCLGRRRPLALLLLLLAAGLALRAYMTMQDAATQQWLAYYRGEAQTVLQQLRSAPGPYNDRLLFLATLNRSGFCARHRPGTANSRSSVHRTSTMRWWASEKCSSSRRMVS